ncbi:MULTISPECIES: CRISPR-associated helicase Cas3' [Bifidobacterium]|uniref:CRISPR-associated helicase Cas3' n=1 Tax=Bifidobacterium TaxID=1678 RepID=UPI00298CAE18|nr:CRISPR-associated helicase Cas3' [Bifidobacterium saimiriisciurei]
MARKDDDGNVQTLFEHLHNAGELAAGFESRSVVTARMAGLLHDEGKATQTFQNYLLHGDKRRGEVVHAWQGAFTVSDQPVDSPAELLTQEMLELAIANHHGCLPDCISFEGDSPFFDKLSDGNKTEERYHYQEVLSHVPSLDLDVQDNFAQSVAESVELLQTIGASVSRLHSRKQACNSMGFYLGLYGKYMYSRLVDADRLDAARFESRHPYYTPNTPDWAELIRRLETHLGELDTSKPINRIRSRISEDCLKASGRTTGIYRLGVPTGGGKTLASLRFALHHAMKTGKKHIIYVIPYLSITSQTVDVFRSFLDLEDDGSDVLLEHYSSVMKDDEQKEERRRLATERWDNPIIVTTMVQFLETVMSARASKLRKFHNMADSVIIFDEIQALPTNTINLFNEIVSFLSNILDSTILLCSATQPLLEHTARENLLLSDNPDLIGQSDDYAKRLRRTNIIASSKNVTVDELASIIFDKAQENGNCLAIVNLRSEARKLYEKIGSLNETLDDDRRFVVVHLSTSMCGRHRKDRLQELRKMLAKNRPIICLSTQLIEAGVDVSFACVVRAMAGLDSILQAAGRCNRNGESKEPKNVYVYPIADERGLDRLRDIKLGKAITQQLVHMNPDADLMSETMIAEYYRFYLDRQKGEMMDCKMSTGETAYDLLSADWSRRREYENRKKQRYAHVFAQAFRTVSDDFHVIARETTDVVVRYGKAMELIDQLGEEDLATQIRILRQLQDYSVSLFDSEFKTLNENGRIAIANEEFGVRILNEENYNPEYGVVLNADMPLLSM